MFQHSVAIGVGHPDERLPVCFMRIPEINQAEFCEPFQHTRHRLAHLGTIGEETLTLEQKQHPAHGGRNLGGEMRNGRIGNEIGWHRISPSTFRTGEGASVARDAGLRHYRPWPVLARRGNCVSGVDPGGLDETHFSDADLWKPHARTSLTTLPFTSVKRKSRPEYRKVSFSWSRPIRCRMVACRS